MFIHGSITDKLIKYGLENGKVNINKINRDVSMWLQGKKTIVPDFLKDTDDENPLFSRLYSDKKTLTEAECNKMNKQLSYFADVDYVIMGHSRFKNINSTCDKKLIRTDVSLSRAFGGTLKDKDKLYQALEITDFKKKPIFKIITKTGYKEL